MLTVDVEVDLMVAVTAVRESEIQPIPSFLASTKYVVVVEMDGVRKTSDPLVNAVPPVAVLNQSAVSPLFTVALSNTRPVPQRPLFDATGAAGRWMV
jgi:hypothetical protein